MVTVSDSHTIAKPHAHHAICVTMLVVLWSCSKLGSWHANYWLVSASRLVSSKLIMQIVLC